jgi:hypothetical protein
MKDHPDEFLLQRKWDELINEFGGYFTEEELNAYKAARGEMMRDLFNEAVLKRLAGEEDEGKTPPSTATGRQAFGWTDPKALFGQAVINNPQLAAKQAKAAMQQVAYNQSNSILAQHALERDKYMQDMRERDEYLIQQRQGNLNSLGSLGNFIQPF